MESRSPPQPRRRDRASNAAPCASLPPPCPAILACAAAAQETPVAIGISGWTGFAPLTLAKEAGIFKKNGLDVTIKKIPQKDRHLAIASGDIQCAATTVETWIVWNANGIATTQLFQMDKGMGSDGIVVSTTSPRSPTSRARPSRPPRPAPPATSRLAWILKKNGLSVKDVKVVNARARSRPRTPSSPAPRASTRP